MLIHRGCLIVLGILTMINSGRGQLNPATADDVVKSRQKRIAFTVNSAMGIIFAIAVPLGIPDRNLFMSYNFEGNYNSPADANIYSEGFANFIKGIVEPLTAPSRPPESFGIRKRSTKTHDQPPVTAQITRRQIYKMIRKQLQ
uniref:G-protein coupled receptors family 1 profile domain-containing protein n=1 Tax=Anopheles atroparvus TaxID=41427 RepID=A0AAG5CU86_ANOAO